MSKVPHCLDCMTLYEDFALDMTLPDDQWRLIYPEGVGMLCAGCIVKRAAKVPGAIAVRAFIDFGRTMPSARPISASHAMRIVKGVGENGDTNK